MKKYFLIGIIFINIIFIWLSKGGVYAASFNPEKQTEKFLTAVKKNDFKTIFEMTYYYQTELAQIRSNNPKALWQKLTIEYYESKKNAFFGKKEESLTDAWVRFGGELFGTPTDPVENVRTLMNLLTPSSKWKVLESKRERHFDQWSGRQIDVFVVYVSLGYKTVENSPLIGSKVLKEAILGFILEAKTVLYMRSSRVVKGDVYWGGDPTTDVAVASKLLSHGLHDNSISILEGLQAKRAMGEKVAELLAIAYYERAKKNSFEAYGDGFIGFKKYTDYKWRTDIERAISLNSEIRAGWIAILAKFMRINLTKKFGQYTDGYGTVNSIAKVAMEFARGYPELENQIYPLTLDLARIYVSWAEYEAGKMDFHFLFAYLNLALSLLPDDSNVKREALNKAIKPYLSNFIKLPETYKGWEMIGNVEKILDYFAEWKIGLEPEDKSLFFSVASYIASEYQSILEDFPREEKYRERAHYWKQKTEEWQK